MTPNPLKVALEGDLLTISIGIEALALAAELSPRLENGTDDTPKVVDKKLWAQEVLNGLNDEAEDGTTPVHLMFDDVFERIVEDGAEGIRMPDDDYDHN